jgi:hypothetical protein
LKVNETHQELVIANSIERENHKKQLQEHEMKAEKQRSHNTISREKIAMLDDKIEVRFETESVV